MPNWKKSTARPCGASFALCCRQPRPGQGADGAQAGGVATTHSPPPRHFSSEAGAFPPPRADFPTVLDRLVPAGDLGLAVSGGPDSLALLLLAAEARPKRIRAVTVDHGLRAGSAAEAAEVARHCASLRVPHDVLQVRVEAGASLQAQARLARYSALGKWASNRGMAAIATGHHADDQAETMLMRLARGSGVAGLTGIRERRALTPEVALVRPLLGWRKAELAAVVAAAGMTAVDDPSNGDPRHDRTHARSLLAEHGWLQPHRLAQSAAALASAEQALVAWTDELAMRHLSVAADGICLREMGSLVPEMQRRLLVRAFAGQPGKTPSGPEIERALQMLREGGTLTLRGLKLAASGSEWLLLPEPPRR